MMIKPQNNASVCTICGCPLVDVSLDFERCINGHTYRINKEILDTEERNWPDTSYLHSECHDCQNPFMGPKRKKFCRQCTKRIMAPVPEYQDIPFVAATSETYTYQRADAMPPSWFIAAVDEDATHLAARVNDEQGRFVSPSPLPTPYQRELLTILMEECAEVTQRASKMIRFGITEVQPGQKLNNRERLSLEVGNLLEMFERIFDFALNENRMNEGRFEKQEGLKRYLQSKPEDRDAA
jgi:hypothetical protein